MPHPFPSLKLLASSPTLTGRLRSRVCSRCPSWSPSTGAARGNDSLDYGSNLLPHIPSSPRHRLMSTPATKKRGHDADVERIGWRHGGTTPGKALLWFVSFMAVDDIGSRMDSAPSRREPQICHGERGMQVMRHHTPSEYNSVRLSKKRWVHHLQPHK